MPPVGAFDAVILAGGGATRLDGVDKMLLRVGPDRLIDRAVAATAAADRQVIVGPPRPLSTPVLWAREEPPGGGPVAALAAGLALVRARVVVLLAADLPFVSAPVVDRLLVALDGDRQVEGVQFVDPAGRDQPLLSAWRADALRRVLPADPAGRGLLRVLAGLPVRRLPAGVEALDCDTAQDVERARQLARQADRRPLGPDERGEPR